MKWISVKDAMPLNGKMCITYRPGALDIDMIAEYCIDGVWRGDLVFSEPVTHWMYLPKPPEVIIDGVDYTEQARAMRIVRGDWNDDRRKYKTDKKDERVDTEKTC